MRLPDWSTHPYLRQYSDAYAAGRQLKQEIQSHSHGLTINDAGGHTPQAYPIDLGTRSGSLTLNGRFWTNTTGNHNHTGSTTTDGNHRHGTPKSESNDGVGDYLDSSWKSHNGYTYTSYDGSHKHGLSINSNGNHNHYVDVNFGTRSVSIALGSYTVRLHAVPNHKHTGSVHSFGGAETRPNSTVVVYAVKVKYITQL